MGAKLVVQPAALVALLLVVPLDDALGLDAGAAVVAGERFHRSAFMEEEDGVMLVYILQSRHSTLARTTDGAAW